MYRARSTKKTQKSLTAEELQMHDFSFKKKEATEN